ncbi:MAG TPA: PTS sugar transporter subunit IIA [Candidatus Acidoferrum sp.]|nr:PTS sugar transporter subunit IIA [Candidatus Acidoferrum sp.]
MPYRTLGVDEVASYLHLSRADIERLVKDRDIPFEKRGSRLVFLKGDIDAWVSPRILGLEGRGLAEYHQKTSQDTRQIVPGEAIMPDRIRPEFIDSALPAKTKASVLREMAALAGRTGRVCDPKALLEGLQAREELCSTGLPGGLALLHARSPGQYLFDAPFLVLGRTVQQIPFGAPDGQPTNLFFLIGCPDERMHLHALARLCMMAQKTDLIAELRAAPDSTAMCDALLAAEQRVLESRPATAT